jgi:hypothetical protein
MKYQNIFVYSVLAIGLLSIPSLLDSIYAQTNATQQNQTAQNQTAQNQTAGQQGQALSPDIQALLTTLDIPELKDTLMNAKEALADGNTEEALTSVTEVENQLLTVQPQPKFTGDFKNIKDSIAKADLAKALDDLNKVQTEVLKAETEIFKAGQTNPQIMEQYGGNGGDGGDGGDEGNGDGGDGA